jgi:hypothetical protein
MRWNIEPVISDLAYYLNPPVFNIFEPAIPAPDILARVA